MLAASRIFSRSSSEYPSETVTKPAISTSAPLSSWAVLKSSSSSQGNSEICCDSSGNITGSSSGSSSCSSSGFSTTCSVSFETSSTLSSEITSVLSLPHAINNELNNKTSTNRLIFILILFSSTPLFEILRCLYINIFY